MKKGMTTEKVKTDEVTKEKMMEEKQRLEQKRRRAVHGAIMDLTEIVGAAELNLALNDLDVNSWLEVLEERFIARVCGWPLCSEPLNIPVRKQKYKLDKKNQKVYETYSTSEKFCSLICFSNHEHVKKQLNELPLWLTGERQSKNYELFADHQNCVQMDENKKSDEVTDLPKQTADSIEFIPDKLLVQLHSLHIAENAGESSSDEETAEADDENVIAMKKKEDDRQFLSNIQSFISSKTGKSEPTKEKLTMDKKKQDSSLTDVKLEEKLERLRSKWGKKSQNIQKKPPVFVEPHFMPPADVAPVMISEPMSLKLKLDKTLESVLEKLKQWITPDTLLYDDDVRSKHGPVFEEFFGSFGDPHVSNDKRRKGEETNSVNLPLVDNVDIHYRRVDILLVGIKNSWETLLGHVQLNFPIQHVKNFVATFDLNKFNCVIDRNESKIVTTLLFHLTLMFIPELKNMLEQKETLDLYDNYLKSMNLQRKTVDKCLNELLESKKTDVN